MYKLFPKDSAEEDRSPAALVNQLDDGDDDFVEENTEFERGVA